MMSSGTSSVNIPEEILIRVFQFLDINTRLTTRLVCKQWLRIMDAPTLLDKAAITFPTTTTKKTREILACEHNFTNFIFEGTTIDLPCISFLMERRKHLYSLTFLDCSIHTDLIGAVTQIEECTKLKKLEIRNCNVFDLFSKLPNLEDLVIGGKIDFDDPSLLGLQEKIPNLKSLSFQSNAMHVFQPRLRNDCILPNPFDGTFPSTSPDWLDFISRYTKTLISLTFNKSRISSSCALKISEMEGLRLCELSFQECLLVTGGICEICKNQPDLTYLDLSSCSQVDDDIVKSICQTLPNLTVLLLENCILDTSISLIFQLPKLQKLDLSGCISISENSFDEALTSPVISELLHLNLKYCRISDAAIRRLLHHARKLQHLDLTSCDVTDAIVLEIKKFKNLKQFRLIVSDRVSKNGLRGKTDSQIRTSNGLEGLHKLAELRFDILEKSLKKKMERKCEC